MRIVTLTSSQGRSGGVRQAEYQTACLRAMGHDAVLCFPFSSALWTETGKESWWVRLPEREADWRGVLEDLFGDGPAVLHAFHNRAVKLAAWWGLGWRRRGVACVAHRGIITRPKNPLPYWSPAIRRFIVNSRACRRSLGWYCPSGRISVVPNGVPDARITPLRPADEIRADLRLPGGLVWGYIGNPNPLKGTDILIRAFALAGRMCPEMASSTLIMVGGDVEKWLPPAQAEGVEDRVRILPQYAHVSDILQVCDAFVFPSRGMDSAPNVLLEAVRMGLPVVCSDVGGVPDILDGNGLMVPRGKVEPLAEAMAEMARDRDRRREWGARSLVVGARFSVESRCRALLDIYREVLEN